jgi:hypothetical protein
VTDPVEARIAAVLFWIVGGGWGIIGGPWLIWWMLVRGRLPVLPLIGEPNAGPFYANLPHGVFVVLLAASAGLGIAQVGAGCLLWNGERTGGLLQFGLLPIEALFWYGFALPIPPLLAFARVILVILAWSRLS